MESKNGQLNQVVQCVGAGVLECGVAEVRSTKLNIELGFARAWRKWSRSDMFPSIDTDPGGLFWLGLGKSSRRRGALISWDRGQWSAPRILTDGWTAADCLEVLADERATAADWHQLATAFTDTFDVADIRRE